MNPINRNERLKTPILAYGTSKETASWPGPTLMATSGDSSKVEFVNELVDENGQPERMPITSLSGKSVVDTSLHWAYSLHMYDMYTLENNGIPIVTHLHGAHADEGFDGGPEHFYTYNYAITGPDWEEQEYVYQNDQPAGTLWYHDHVLGITRLNVYAGLAGFYILRDENDDGSVENHPLNLPAGDYEKAYAIQDRMFKKNGELFYPAFKGDPYYEDFIIEEGADWDSKVDGATALAEFFGDFMLVNGKIWPKEDVEPWQYRLRLLNGCDSRFIVIKLLAVEAGRKSTMKGIEVEYTIIGTDQGLLDTPLSGQTSTIVETGGRLDIVVDFSGYEGMRIIMANEGGDEPFGGDIPGPQIFAYTDMVMAFDVHSDGSGSDPEELSWNLDLEELPVDDVTRVRRVGLFEGMDEFGRLQPMLGGELTSNVVETFTWSDDTTETPAVGTIEEWEIFNFSEDAVSAQE